MDKGFNYQRFYDRIASFYAAGIALIPAWRRYTEAALPWLPPTGAILEIGPGPGVLHRQLAERYPILAALDLSPGMLRETRQRLRRAGFRPRLVRGDATHLPFASNSLDGIVLTFVFSAIPDGDAAMRDITRTLRPGGTVALVDACVPSDGNRLGSWLARLWERFGDYMRDEASLMQAVGLDVIECREFGAFNGIRLTVGRRPHANNNGET